MKFVFSFLLSTLAVAAADIRVVVWDEQQPRQKAAYENFLGNAIARQSQDPARTEGALGAAG